VTSLELEILLLRLAVVALLYSLILAVGVAVWIDLRRSAVPPVAGLEEPRPRLIVLDGHDTGHRPGEVFVLRPTTALGRSLDNDVVLPSPTVSPNHAVITYAQEAWWLEDLGSATGSRVNAEPVIASQPELLRSGDEIQLGRVRLRLVTPGL
jgi:hypothetical protein